MENSIPDYEPAALPVMIKRRGISVMNPSHFGAVNGQVRPEYHAALELMLQIYSHKPVSEQPTVTKQLLDEHGDQVAKYIWWHAFSTGHELVAKAVTDSEHLSLQGPMDVNTPVEIFKESIMAPVLAAADDVEETERLAAFLGEHDLYAEELLFKAAVKGKDGVIRKLLVAHVSPASEKVPSLATLHAACFQGHLKCAKLLVEKGGLSVDHRDEFGGTPLQRAAVGGHINIVIWLLGQGADVKLRTYPKPGNALHGELDALTFAAYRAHTDIVKCLLDANATVTHKSIPAAAEGGSEEILDLLLGKAGYPIHSDLAGSDWKGTKLTAEQRENLVTTLNYSGSRASPSFIRKILAYFAPLDESNQQTKVGAGVEASAFNALKLAARHDSAASAKILIDFLQNNVETAEPGDNEMLAWSVRVYRTLSDLVTTCSETCAIQTLNLLIREYGLSINTLHSQYQTTALYHAARDGHADLLRTLVTEFGADIHLGNGRFANGPTALWKAVDGGHELAVRALLELGGPIEGFDGELSADTKTVYVLAIADYRAPVVLAAEHDPRWNEAHLYFSTSQMEYVCLEYPDGLWWLKDVVSRKADAELEDERGLRAPPEDLSVD